MVPPVKNLHDDCCYALSDTSYDGSEVMERSVVQLASLAQTGERYYQSVFTITVVLLSPDWQHKCSQQIAK